MAKKSNGRNSVGKYANNQFEFVNISFSSDDITKATAWLSERKIDAIGAMGTIADLNCKVSVGLNSWTGNYTASVSSKDDSKPIYKKALVYEHSDLERLICIMQYVLVEMYDSGNSLMRVATEEIDW